MVSGIYAQSAHSVYAIGNGNDEDDAGPTVVLHYNGHSWGKVAGVTSGTAPSRASRSPRTALAAYGFRCPAGVSRTPAPTPASTSSQ